MSAATLPATFSDASPSGAAAPALPRPVLVQPEGGRHLDAFGDHLHVLLSSADTGGALAVGIGTTPPGGGPPPHVHRREAEVFVVLEGDVEFFAAGSWTRVAPGGAVFLPAGLPHTFRNVGATPCRCLIVATPGGFEQFFADCSQLFAAGGPPDMAEVFRISAAHGIEYPEAPGAPSAGS